MSLNPVSPGLRALRYRGASPAKVSLIVADGSDLVVPDDVAEQLLAQSLQFKDATPVEPEPAPVVEDEAPKRGRKPKAEADS